MADTRRRATTRARTVLRLLCLVVGWVVLVAAVDLGAGLLLGVADGSAGPGGVVRAVDLGAGDGPQVEEDQRSSPAFAGAEWADQYWAEFVELRFDAQPYVGGLIRRAPGPLITVDGGVRRSATPAPADGALDVWFFGGSTTFGQGQRDEHTIPSELARVAWAEGVPVRPVNFGIMGATTWQELHRFVGALAERPTPDLVVFYDGVNDLAVARQQPGPQPSHYEADRYGIVGTPWSEDQASEQQASGAPTTWDRWWEVSLAGKAWRRLTGVPAASAGVDDLPTLYAEATERYVRARDLVEVVAAEAGVPVRFFIQPDSFDTMSGLADAVGAPSIDLTDALDGIDPDEVYLDGAHTNERGARLVGEAMWPHLRSALAPPTPAASD